MKKEDILPVGSIVEIKGCPYQILIIGRAILSEIGVERIFNDYTGCFYPQGMIDDNLFYFNNDDITNILYTPPLSEDEETLKKTIMKVIEDYKSYKNKNEDQEW